MKTKINTWDMKISNSFSHIREHKFKDDESYLEGNVVTPHGIVEVYAQGNKNISFVTSLHAVHNGRYYAKTFDKKRYSRTYMVTLANRFMKELIGGELTEKVE